jgi:glycosyltransferase involved in cell wall biosynthesis
MKSILMIASCPSMIGQFNMSNIDILIGMGYKVHVACNFNEQSVWTQDKVDELVKFFKNKNILYHQIDFSRSPKDIKSFISSYKQLKKLVMEEKFDFIHCHAPIPSVIARMVAHKTKTKIMYTAHGFHFFKGAPLKNWLIYYPVEKFYSHWTDVLITINKEDYNRACKKFHAKKVLYIPGVGLDTIKFEQIKADKISYRQILCIPYNAFLLISVGELHDRKNQRIIIEALHVLNNPNIYYIAVGKGQLYDEYMKLIKEYKLENNVKLLGFRSDIGELCKVSDCFVHPSVREGLGIAPLEAMACGLPLISTYINGIKDYTEDGVSGCCIMDPLSVDEMVAAISKMYSDSLFRETCAANNLETVKRFDITETEKIMKETYEYITSELVIK